ncbi:MAG: potassium transporter TrkA [Actinomycetales bacterium]|nr:potassium transporter TrkA [Actinomycetales bacterium]
MTEVTLRGHVVVYGFRGVGRRVVKQMAKTGVPVVVLQPDATPAEILAMQRYQVTYLPGFGQSSESLDAANVAEASAAICVTDDDLLNIEIALLVRERSSRIRIVVQMANAAVGRALQTVTQPGAVLNVAELASLSFVEAAINRTTHSLDLDGREFIVATEACRRTGALDELWPALSPLALESGSRGRSVACPGRSEEAEEGDRVTLVGTPEQFRDVGLDVSVEQRTRQRRPLRSRVRESLAAIGGVVDRPFRIAFGILAGLAFVSVVILRFGYTEPDGTRMSLLDAIYFTSETIATVGFGDFYFRDQPDWLRIWAAALILLGATLIAVSTALLTNALVTRSLAQSLGRQRLTGMRDHIVVIGLGTVGIKVARDLHDLGHDVAIIDGGEGQRFIPEMRSLGMPVLIGDATLPETQADAGVHRAAGIAILTSSDLTNLDTGLSVREVVRDPSVPIVLRLFGKNLARVVKENLEIGIPRSIAELAAPWFVGAALGLETMGTFYVGEMPFIAVRVSVHSGGRFEGRTVRRLEDHVRVIGVRRADDDGRLQCPPPGDLTFRPGDIVYLIGQYEDLVDLLPRT